ncbi:thioesterase [bacterium]|nr:thioesterase [bacterium]
MERLKIELPEQWQFETEIEIRVTDLNYGNHLANQNILTYAHEARVRFYKKYGFSEMDFGGTSLIQADAAILFQGEGHLGDRIKIKITAIQSGGSSFQVYYLFTNQEGKKVASLRTAMVCFDYKVRKPVRIPQEVLESGLLAEH